MPGKNRLFITHVEEVAVTDRILVLPYRGASWATFKLTYRLRREYQGVETWESCLRSYLAVITSTKIRKG